jgi:hypothetical protein
MPTAIIAPIFDDDLPVSDAPDIRGAAITWSSVLGGAIVVAATSLILMALGAGLGLSTISPFSDLRTSSKVIGGATIAWLIIWQFLSGSLGGYLAGRFRNRWSGIHTDEVYFRDTAHGFLAWALAFVVSGAFLATATTFLAGAAVSTPATSATETKNDPQDYFVDMMFRTTATAPEAVTAEQRAEMSRILTRALAEGGFVPGDRAYAAQLVATRTGVDATAAQQRVDNVLAQAQTAVDATRKAAGHTLLWIFLALLIGAFCASLGATIGGRQRDHVLPAA